MAIAGKIVINLSAGTADFINGVENAAKSLKAFGGHAEESAGMFSKFTEGLEIGAGIEAVKAGFEIAEKAMEAVIDVTKEAIATAAEWTKAAMEQAEQAVTLSTSLGLNVETIQGLGKAGKEFGLAQEDVATGLEHFSKRLGEMSLKSDDAGDSLKAFGIDAKKLADESPDKALRDVADAIAHIDNHAQQAAVTTELFGKSGLKLLPLFSEGSKGIDEAIAKGLKFGDVLTGMDASRLVAAKQATDEVGRAFNGLQDQLAIALAPIIKGIANEISDLAPGADKMRQVFTVAFTEIVQLAAYAGDGIAHLAGFVLEAAADTELLIAAVEKSLGDGHGAAEAKLFAEQLHNMANAANSVGLSANASQWLAKVTASTDDAAKHIEDRMTHSAEASAAAFVENSKKIGDILKGLKAEIATFGMDEGKKNIFELQGLHASPEQIAEARADEARLHQLDTHKKVLDEIKHLQEEIGSKSGDAFTAKATELIGAGADPKEIQQLVALNDQLKAVEQHHKNLEAAKELWKESETPLQKYQDKLAEINKLLADHALTQAQADQARQKAAQELGKAQSEGINKQAALVERRFDFRLAPGQQTQDTKKEALDLQKQQLQYTQKWDQWIHDLWMNNGQTAAQAVVLDLPL